MSFDIPIKCRCGAVRGVISDASRSTNRRGVCYCRDCRAFPIFLGCAGEVLDAQGGTEIVPTYPSKIKITQGFEKLKCVKMSDDGMHRWFAGCCKMPVANLMASPAFPFAGVHRTILDFSDTGKTCDEALGPIYARLNAHTALGPLPAGPTRVLIYTLRTIWFLLKGAIRRQNQPSPFFGPNGKPTLEPLALSNAEYEDLIAKATG